MGKLRERLAEDGVFVDWKSADWVPGVGVRLRELALYRDVARHDRLALFDRVTARRPEPSWLRWDRINFKAADTQVLVGSGAAETRLEHLHLLLLIEPGKTDLRECHASLRGLRIEAKFLLVDARDPETVAASKQVAQSEGLFRDVSLDWLKSVKEWLTFQPEKDEPILKMDLHSFADNKGLALTMTLDGARFQWRGQNWDFVQAAMEIPIGRENAPIGFDHVRIGHGGGKQSSPEHSIPALVSSASASLTRGSTCSPWPASLCRRPWRVCPRPAPAAPGGSAGRERSRGPL